MSYLPQFLVGVFCCSFLQCAYVDHPCRGWCPGADGASTRWLKFFFFFLSVSNWFLINKCNQSWAFTPSSPLTEGANLEGCEYFRAHLKPAITNPGHLAPIIWRGLNAAWWQSASRPRLTQEERARWILPLLFPLKFFLELYSTIIPAFVAVLNSCICLFA